MISLLRILAVVRKEFLQLKRDRLTLAMIVMIPLIQLVLFGYAINTEVRHIPTAVVDHSQTSVSRNLIQIVEATQVVRFIERFSSVREAERAIVRSDIRAALIIPEDFDERLARNPAIGSQFPTLTGKGASRPVAHWIADGSDTLVAGAIRSLRTMPLAELFKGDAYDSTPTFEVTLFYNPEQRTVVNIVPGLVGIILTMTMIMFTSAAIVRERERGNMEMLINTPIRPSELMLGKIIPYIGIGLIQVVIILGLGWLLFSVNLTDSLSALLLITVLFILASLSLGLVISTLATSQLQAMQMTVFILMPSILLSGFMFPYEGMPDIAQKLADLLPATHFIRSIRGIVLREAGIQDLVSDAYWMLAFSVLGLLIASLRFRKKLD
jgi:ABC-2 type transport system permease protein